MMLRGGILAILALAVTAGPVLAVSLTELPGLQNAGAAASFPDIDTSTDNSFAGANGSFIYDLGDPTRGAFEYQTTFVGDGIFRYTIDGTTSVGLNDASLSISANFARLGELGTSLGGAATGTFTLMGVPDASVPGFSNDPLIGDVILTGSLLAVGTQALGAGAGLEFLWNVTGGRAASNFGAYAYSIVSSQTFSYDSNGLVAFAFTDLDDVSVNFDTKPGQVVPLPPAALALAAAIAGLAAFRRRRRV